MKEEANNVAKPIKIYEKVKKEIKEESNMDSTIIASVIGAIATIISGIIGYFIGYNKKIIQKQNARNNATQIQVGDIDGRE